MPNYDFKCTFCSTVVELQDPTPIMCTTCGNTMQRIWTSVAVKFNGTGWGGQG